MKRTYDYVIASRSLHVKIRNVEVVEDFESRPLKAVSFVEGIKQSRNGGNKKCLKHSLQWWDAALGEVKQKRCKEEEDEEKEDQERQMRSEVTKGIIAGAVKEADTVGGVTRNVLPVTQSINVRDSENIGNRIGAKR